MKIFNCRSTKNLQSTKLYILLTALYFSDVCVFRAEGERKRPSSFGHLPFNVACSHEFWNWHDSYRDTEWLCWVCRATLYLPISTEYVRGQFFCSEITSFFYPLIYNISVCYKQNGYKSCSITRNSLYSAFIKKRNLLTKHFLPFLYIITEVCVPRTFKIKTVIFPKKSRLSQLDLLYGWFLNSRAYSEHSYRMEHLEIEILKASGTLTIDTFQRVPCHNLKCTLLWGNTDHRCQPLP